MSPLSLLVRDDPIKQKSFEWMIKTYSEKGKLEVPPSSQNVNGAKKMNGYEIMGSGFDASHLQVRCSIFELDNEKEYSEYSNFNYDEKYMVPKSIEIEENNKNIFDDEFSVFKDKEEYTNHLNKEMINKKSKFYGRRNYNYFEYIKEATRYQYQKTVNWYSLRLKNSIINDSAYLSRDFKLFVSNNLKKEYNEETKVWYRHLIEIYGTHVVVKSDFGKRFVSYLTEDVKMNENEIKKMLEYNLNKKLKLVNYESENLKMNDLKFKNVNENTDVLLDSYVNAIPINYEIVPIFRFIKNKIVSQNLKIAVNEYLKEMSIY
jgi:hypothetical protein